MAMTKDNVKPDNVLNTKIWSVYGQFPNLKLLNRNNDFPYDGSFFPPQCQARIFLRMKGR